MVSNLKEFLAEDLSRVSSLIADSTESKEHLVTVIANHLLSSTGKKLRPILTIIMSKIFNCSNTKYLYLAAAVELIHAATLLHDDVVDESKMRRSNPTANSVWGNKASILVGDFLFSQAFKFMVESGSIEALRCLSQASATIAEGEVMQLAHTFNNHMLSIEDYHKIANAKTAELFAASAEVGAIISDNVGELSMHARRFGEILGLIFQVQDDMIDYFGKGEVSGKNLGDDLSQGNITFPVIIAHTNASVEDQKLIEGFFFESLNRISHLKELVLLMEKYNTRQYVGDYLRSLYGEAIRVVDLLPYSDPYSKYLIEILDFAMSRDR